MGVRFPPGRDQRLKFLLAQTHLDSAHRLQRADGTAVAKGQFGDLALLPEVAVHTVLLDRDAEHP